MTKEFEAAKEAFLRGDPRKLAGFVRTTTLAPEQAEFVAQALSGEVKMKDGRAEKTWTRNLYFDYVEIQVGGALREMLFGKKLRVSKAEIYRNLAKLHGYADEDAVKKAIARAKKRRSGITDEEFRDRLKRLTAQGRNYKIAISADALKWMLEHWCGDTTDYKLPDEITLSLDENLLGENARKLIGWDTIKK